MILDRLCVLGAYLDLPVDDGRKEQRIVLSSHVCKVHAPQTKILQRVTKDDMRVLEVLFKGVSTGFGLRTIEKYLENPHFIFCSVFQNLRLEIIGSQKINTSHHRRMRLSFVIMFAKFMLPKRRFRTFEQTVWRLFLK